MSTPEATEITDILRRRLVAIAACDSKTLASLLHEQYCYMTSTGLTLDKKTFLNQFTTRNDNIISITPKITSMKIDRDVATVTSDSIGSFLLQDQRHEGIYHATHILVKLNGSWLFLAGHYYQDELLHQAATRARA